MAGPLTGIRIVEIAGIGPGPFCAMMLGDMGADVVRIDRTSSFRPPGVDAPRFDVNARSRRSVAIDLKNPAGIETALTLIDQADALIEGFRPGVMERLGLGPEVCLARNERLVYGRMTGWGQDGPLATAAGHDINYIALSGVLSAIGRQGEAPVPPLNLVGDFGGGGLLLAFGIVAGIVSAKTTGVGQVVDAAMVDGAALLASMFAGFRASGFWNDERGTNMLDTGAPYYDTYRCADGEYIAIGSIEPQFYALLMEQTGLGDDATWPDQNDRAQWPAMKTKMAEVIATKTRAEWSAIMEGTDVCFAPVLSLAEAPHHPHNAARQTYVERFGVTQPAPAPRFSATPGSLDVPPPVPGEHTDAVLSEWGFGDDDIAELRKTKAIL